MSIDSKFSTGESSFFGSPKSYFKSMQFAVVELSGKDDNGNVVAIPVNQTNPVQKFNDEAFNADPYIIRCRISGNDYDNAQGDKYQLPNCYPLMPKFGAPIPKVGEVVLVFMFGPDERYSDRFYIGPITSDLRKINKQSIFAGATANLITGFYKDVPTITNDENTKGVYSEYDNDNTFAINGRNNADIVFKNSEVLLRAGKFVQGNTKQFNNQNPAYIQIKSNVNIKESESDEVKNVSVNNIVADKINLLTYNGSPNFDLTNRDLINNKTPYITDTELNKIINEAHPLVFGDVLLEYLVALRKAFENHIHNQFGAAPPTDNIQKGSSVQDFKKLATNLETKMLSKNIRIN